jgi:hypothetical protein
MHGPININSDENLVGNPFWSPWDPRLLSLKMIHITLLEGSEDNGDLVTCDGGQFEEEELVLSVFVQYGMIVLEREDVRAALSCFKILIVIDIDDLFQNVRVIGIWSPVSNIFQITNEIPPQTKECSRRVAVLERGSTKWFDESIENPGWLSDVISVMCQKLKEYDCSSSSVYTVQGTEKDVVELTQVGMPAGHQDV